MPSRLQRTDNVDILAHNLQFKQRDGLPKPKVRACTSTKGYFNLDPEVSEVVGETPWATCYECGARVAVKDAPGAPQSLSEA